MLVKYCPRCFGKPYTDNFNQSVCPICGSSLQSEMVDNSSLLGRPILNNGLENKFDSYCGSGFSDNNPFEEAPFGDFGDSFGDNSENGSFDVFPSENSAYAPVQDESSANHEPGYPANIPTNHNFSKQVDSFSSVESVEEPSSSLKHSSVGMMVAGKISRYSVTDRSQGYKRFFITKLIDAFFYHQRTDDVLHRFTVRVDQGKDSFGYSIFKDIPVNVHGNIAGGVQLDENADVEVTGKYKNNVLMAKSIDIVNSGYRSRVNFQHSRQGILYGILVAVAIIFLIYVGGSYNGGFFENIGSFFVAWLISAVIVTVLYLLLFISRFGRFMAYRNKGFPFVGILLVSFIMALLYMNMFGLGTSVGGALSGALSSILPSIIVIVAIVFLIRLIFKR